MITEIRVSNFYSIGEEVKISFIRNGKKPDEGYYQYKDSKNVSLVNGFFGVNASGKTNVLRAIVTLINLIYTSPNPNNIYNPNQNLFAIFPNYNYAKGGEVVELGANFLFGDNLYKYDLKIKNNAILHEKLEVAFNQSQKTARFGLVFERNEGGQFKVGNSFGEVDKMLRHITLRLDHTFLSILQYAGFDPKSMEVILKDFRNNKYLLNAGQNEQIPSFVNIIHTGLNMKLNPILINNKALEITTEALRLFDNSIATLEIVDTSDNPKVLVIHRGFSSPVDMTNESRGTQELFVYIYSIIDILRNGGVVVYDEINRFYHPDIQQIIFKLFLSVSKNSKNAQLFFSSHDHEIMGSLESDQLFIVEKENSGSVVTKISDFDIDTRSNISKKYRLGVFGATPDISNINFNFNEWL